MLLALLQREIFSAVVQSMQGLFFPKSKGKKNILMPVKISGTEQFEEAINKSPYVFVIS